MITCDRRAAEDIDFKPIRCGTLLPMIFPLLLLFAVFSLATLAKLVTYTPYGCESAQYSSIAGRRMVSDTRRVAGKQTASVQSAKRPSLRSKASQRPRPTDPLILASIHGPGIIPLRSPPTQS